MPFSSVPYFPTASEALNVGQVTTILGTDIWSTLRYMNVDHKIQHASTLYHFGDP